MLSEPTEKAADGHAAAEMQMGGGIAVVAPAAPPAEADGLLAVIERIATNPSANLDALDRIMALRERAAASAAKAAFDRDLSAMQPELPTINGQGKIVVYSKADRESGRADRGEAAPMQQTPYALLADINDAIRPALATHGFAISHRIGQASDGKITVTGILSHRQGHREETTITLMHDSTGSKNSVQAVGSTISYGRRYTTLALLNISSRAPQDMDDDGRAAGGKSAGTITNEQAAEIEALINETNSAPTGMLEYVGAASIEGMTPAQYAKAKAALLKKRTAAAKKGAAA